MLYSNHPTQNKSQRKSSSKEEPWVEALGNFVEALFKTIFCILQEIYHGLRYKTMPWFTLSLWVGMFYMIFTRYWDYHVYDLLQITDWYPRNPTLHQIYFWFCVSFPVWGWTIIQVFKRRKLKNKTEATFLNAGLKHPSGKTPDPIFDLATGDGIRTLRVKRAGFPLSDFEKSKSYIEGGMGVYVDQIRENRHAGTVDIDYSKEPITSHVDWYPVNEYDETAFNVGVTRTQFVTTDLKQSPHLLIAGQTGSGKSTFLRQLITQLFLAGQELDDIEMTLIDLKGGLEFQVFEKLPNIRVIPNMSSAVKELKLIQAELDRRMGLLKKYCLKDIDSLKERKNLYSGDLVRKLVVVDEAAEIFLSGYHADSAQLAVARRIISQIARQGRAVGVHLVMATQRPDARALDPQVKTNLTGIICFQMPNNISSQTVIDVGRATQLPDVPGRAIWKRGGRMLEVQTPYLSLEKASQKLRPYRKKEERNTTSSTQKQKPELEVFE